jgi:OOP family OmpA-OmpF porin
MRFSIVLSSLLTAAAVTAGNAVAEPYVGIGIGSASYKVNLSALGGGEFDDNGTGTKLYGGYAFNKYFAAEATVYNFAEASVGAIETSPGSGTFVSGAASMTGVGAYAVGMYPVSKTVSLIAKLGMLNWDADLSVNNTSATNDGTDAAYALAVSYAISKEFLMNAEWESFNTDNPEVSMLSLGFRFNFR